MLDALAAAAINHLLQGAAWARERMVPFAGASVRFHLPPASATFSIGEDGTLQPAASGVEPAAIIRLTPALALRLALLKDESARAEVEVEGDAALAAALTRILGALSWDRVPVTTTDHAIDRRRSPGFRADSRRPRADRSPGPARPRTTVPGSTGRPG